jgi:hypothetical protein
MTSSKISQYNGLVLTILIALILLPLLAIFKVYCKISVSLGLIGNFKVSDLVMAKVEKVNITDT